MSLASRVYAALRDDILHVRLRPGQPIVEPALSQRFEVSKTPVREALGLLVRDGLVLVMPHKGYVVRPVGYEDVAEIVSLRLLLEPGVAADAARRRLPHQVVELRRSAQQSRSADNSQAEVLASLAFHEQLCGIVGDTRTTRYVAELAFEAHRFWMLPPGPQAQMTIETLDFYDRIVDAVERGDAPGAAEAMRSMLGNVRDYLAAGFGRPPVRLPAELSPAAPGALST